MNIKNVKIYTMDSEDTIIENGYVTVEGNIITAVGEGAPDKDNEDDIDGRGMTLYPGFIDAHTHMGLTSAGVGIEGEDLNEEFDPCTPQLDILDGINPLDYSFEMARQAGITTVIVSPGSTNPIAGAVVAVKTDGRRIDSMGRGRIGMKMALGENPKLTYMDHEQSPVTRMAVASIIKDNLNKAQRYMRDKELAESESDMPDYDSAMEALIPLLKREIKAHFHCHRADDIFTAVRIANMFDLDYILIHCTDGHLIAEELAGEKAGCVVGPVICDRCKPEMANLTPKNAAVLKENGLEVAVCTDHSEVPIEYLPVSVGICIKNGLSFYDGVKAVTSSAAKIVGIDDITGSLEPRKLADMVLFEGNPFEVMSSPALVMIDGKVVRREGV